MSVDFVLVEKPDSLAFFRQAERIYLDSFPVSQIRPAKMIIRMLEFDPNYYLLVAREDDFIVGFSMLYAFNELNTAFLDFMAIDKTYRGRSIGSELFRYTLNVSRRLVVNSIGVFFEVERESPLEYDREGFKYRRVRFYRRHGAKVLENVHYMLPDLQGGEPEDTYLMIIPNREIAYLEKSFVFRAIKSIYLTMYHCYDELDLLDFTIDGLPPRIRLT